MGLIYLEIADDIRYKILARKDNCDYQLTSLRALAQEYEVNHLTIAKAIKLLESEGFIYKKIGHGTFVNMQRTNELKEQYKTQFLKVEVVNFAKKAKALGISTSDLSKMIFDNQY